MNRGLSKNIKYADAYNIPFVLFVGEDELKSGEFKLKNLKSGEEKVAKLTILLKEIPLI
jgi:histidyl-tRNA synthetase